MAWARSHRGVVLTLALLALTLKVAIPAGYMARPATDTLPFAIVICTAQGAVVVDPGDSPHGDEASPHDAPCVFAGHGLGAGSPTGGFSIVPLAIAYYPVSPPPACEATPGRGLCAPPPPARGPPLSI